MADCLESASTATQPLFKRAILERPRPSSKKIASTGIKATAFIETRRLLKMDEKIGAMLRHRYIEASAEGCFFGVKKDIVKARSISSRSAPVLCMYS